MYELRRVDLAGFQLQHARRVVRDDREAQLVEIGERLSVRPLVPIIGVADQHHLAVMRPALQHERSRADRVFGKGLRLVVQRRAGRVQQQFLRNDGGVEGGQRLEDRRIGVLEMHDDRVGRCGLD